MLSREYGSLAGAGGVKDVASQLAETLARWTGRSLNVVLPLYGFIDAQSLGFQLLQDPVCQDRTLRLRVDMHLPDSLVYEEVCFLYQKINRVHIYLVDSQRFNEKSDVYTYTEKDETRLSWQKKSMGHHDYFAMNLLHQKAALELMVSLGAKPDVIHCHDGHTAIVPALMRETPGYRSYFRATGCLVTIHNAGSGYHQDVADIPYARSITSLPDHVVTTSLLDGSLDPLLVAGHYAVLNTVSENYARELQETESDELTGWLGHELKKRNVILQGVTNGIEPSLFASSVIAGGDPEMLFDPGKKEDDLSGKFRCKSALLAEIAGGGDFHGIERFGSLEVNVEYPLFTFIGRLSEQKGVEVLTEVLGVLLEKDERIQMLILGSGGDDLETRLIALAENEQLRGRICFLRGFGSALANRIYAAGDFFIVPSKYEPCGLTDFIAQLFGNIPVVRHVGGLVKVKDGVTGIAYQGDSPNDLLEALLKALTVYADPLLRRQLQLQAVEEIARKYTWTKVMRKYLELYREARNTQTCQ
ncbi:MAG: glycogen synthase [Desulfobulbaceae bacterium]|nr:glycogen synthase [Desulfobulbaceae bacterium]